MQHPSISLEKAQLYIERLIEQAIRDHRTRLPPIKEMARSADVAHDFISAAVTQLRQKGILDARSARGIHIRSRETEQTQTPQPVTGALWQRVRIRIIGDLATGSFSHDRPIPGSKELSSRYGASYRTIRKALHSLTNEGALIPQGRHYQVAAISASHAHKCIVLFARGIKDGGIWPYTSRVPEYFHAIEKECLDKGLLLKTIPCYYDEKPEVSFSGRNNRKFINGLGTDAVLGYAVWQPYLTEKFVVDLVQLLNRHAKPISLFCESEEPMMRRLHGRSSSIRCITMPSEFEVGRNAGIALLAMGHHRIRIFTANSETEWSSKRIEGLKAVFTEAGFTGGITVSAIKADRSWPIKPVGLILARELEAAIMNVVRQPSSGTSFHLRTDIAENLKFYIESITMGEAKSHLLRPLFTKALEDRAITAWVGINDFVAIEGQAFLESQGIAIPDDISIMGFDDSIDAGYKGLSSYSFNAGGAMHALVEHIIRPNSLLLGRDSSQPFVVPGFLHERETTGKGKKVKNVH